MVQRPLPTSHTVWRGFHWTWASDPPAIRFPSATQRQPYLRDPILDWIAKGVVVPVPDQPCFLSRLFAVPRSDNWPPRLIIDLSRLNEYVVAPLFSLDNHSTLAKLLSPPAFMASLDITEAYTHVPIRPNLCRYLAFSYLGQLYFFHALPFGLNAAPFIFTQVLAWRFNVSEPGASPSWPTWTTLLSGTATRTHSWCRCSRWRASSRGWASDWT